MNGAKWTERIKTWKSWSTGAGNQAQGDPKVLQEALSLACLKKLWPAGAEGPSAQGHVRDELDQAARPWAHGLF
ncbi:hypothetical protein DNFV4_01011 [Nitrospira tepida]|uniref:Uncharacterized protein n=1 Tax=Nitrospira tepida TaxID=2973512 RepID=A0AA86MX07_9BACT|nr:hypothetical protein [Nitrospira tepida]CAI4030583.1 hypothetical protein DNFV4_01011 [Nitrospira tepida]